MKDVLKHKYYNKKSLREFRYKVRLRDNRQCQICGKLTNRIHHILFQAYYPELRYNENNGVVLCNTHENESHGRKLDQIRYMEFNLKKVLLI